MYQFIWKHFTVSSLYENNKIRRRWSSAVLLLGVQQWGTASLLHLQLRESHCCTRR